MSFNMNIRKFFSILILFYFVLLFIAISGCICSSNEDRCGFFTCYNTQTQSCCNGIVHQETTYKQCGNDCYNPETQSCCNGIVYQETTYKQCGNDCYNTKIQSCCNNTVYQGTTPYRLCGDECYNPETQSCCNNMVYQGTGPYKLCGGVCYNPVTQSCCEDKETVCKKPEDCCCDTIKYTYSYPELRFFNCRCYNPATHTCTQSLPYRKPSG